MKIFCDFDETLVHSQRAFVKCVNERFNLSRTEDDIKDWNFKSLDGRITPSIIDEIFECDLFWDNLEEFDGAVNILKRYNVAVCTLGRTKNLSRKYRWLSERNLGWPILGLNSEYGYHSSDKCLFDMSNGIQIDDTFKALEKTNAKYKILFCDNKRNLDWHKVNPCSDIYIADTWKDIDEMLRWLYED